MPTRSLLGIGLNPLVRAASPLLLLTGQLRASVTPMDVPGLRRYALDEIRRFEDHARSAGVQNEIVLAARYALCAGLDEAVLSTPWGAQSEWAQHPLLVALHREAWGGEKFFEMLDRISGDPDRHIDLMELQYLGIAFGFAGKYQVMERGHEHLAKVQRDLYRKIRDHRGTPEPELSLRWRGREDRRNPLVRYVPWWVVGAASVALLAVTFTFYYTRLAGFAAPVHAELSKVGLEDFALPPPRPPRRGRPSSSCWRRTKADGTLRVEENGGRTTVTLLAPDLFASGSATVNPAQFNTLEHLAKALEQRSGPRAGRRPHRRSAGPIAALPGQLRAVARSGGERRQGPAARDRQSGQIELDGRRLFPAPLHPRVRSGEPRAKSASRDRSRTWNLR